MADENNAAQAAAKAAEERRAEVRRQAEAQAKVRAELAAEAERVMSESKPTPTQVEADLIKLGQLHPDDKEDPQNPEMPPLHEQQQRLAQATGENAVYQTRSMEAAPAARQASPPAPTPVPKTAEKPTDKKADDHR